MFLCNDQCIGLELNSKSEVLQKLIDIAYDQNVINDKEKVMNELIAREEVYCTDMQKNIAIPHTRCEFVTKSTVVILKLKNEVSWESENTYGVKVVFCILVPSGDASANEHLQLLSKLAVKLMDEEFVEKIMSEDNAQNILNIMEGEL